MGKEHLFDEKNFQEQVLDLSFIDEITPVYNDDGTIKTEAEKVFITFLKHSNKNWTDEGKGTKNIAIVYHWQTGDKTEVGELKYLNMTSSIQKLFNKFSPDERLKTAILISWKEKIQISGGKSYNVFQFKTKTLHENKIKLISQKFNEIKDSDL